MCELPKDDEGKGCSLCPLGASVLFLHMEKECPNVLIILCTQGLVLNEGGPFNLSSKLGHFGEWKRHH